MIEPLVSVIVPVYNVEKYISECVDSIIAQEYHNLEIILIDDGSTDYSPSICEGYAEKDSRIKVVHQKNSGVARARNRGLAIATGKYIVFVDSDDFISRNMVTSVVSIAENNNDIDIVIGNLSGMGICESNNSFSGVIDQERILNEVIVGKVQNLPIFENQNPYLNGFCTCLYKKELIDRYDISFPLSAIGEDVIFHISYLLKCRNAFFTGESYYYYRFREDSASHRFQPHLVEDYGLYYQTIKEMFADSPINKALETKTLVVFGESAIRRELANVANSRRKIREMRQDIKIITKQEMYTSSITWNSIKNFPFGNRMLHILLKMKCYFIIALYYKFRYQK